MDKQGFSEGFEAKPNTESKLFLERFTVSGNSVSAAVCVSPHDKRVDEELAGAILLLHPTLAKHTCKHRGFGYFGDKLIGTTLPHLVEHLAIDFLVEQNVRASGDQKHLTRAVTAAVPSKPPQAIAGTTSWLDREQGRMQVRISCTAQSSDATCTAIIHAIALVNGLLEQ